MIALPAGASAGAAAKPAIRLAGPLSHAVPDPAAPDAAPAPPPPNGAAADQTASSTAATAPQAASPHAQTPGAQADQATPTTPPLPAPPPGAQLAQAVTALHIRANGSSQLSIRLDPAELGQVHVQIIRGQDGAASVSVAVERPETLRSLQFDLTHLHLALDRAGLPEQRSLSVHLAVPQDASAGPPGAGPQGGGAQPGFHGGAQGGAQGNAQQHASRQPAPFTTAPPADPLGLATRAPRAGPTLAGRNAGLDLVA